MLDLAFGSESDQKEMIDRGVFAPLDARRVYVSLGVSQSSWRGVLDPGPGGRILSLGIDGIYTHSSLCDC